MIRSTIAPAVKRTLVAAIVTGIVSGCGIAGSTTAPSVTSQGQPPQPTAPLEPTSSALLWTGIAAGPFVVTGTDDPVQITVDIASSGWASLSAFDAVTKDDDGLDPPESVGAALGAWGYPAGAGFNVYGDPCRWSSTTPDSPATTVDEIAVGLAAQPMRDATAPVDVTVGGYAGKFLTLHVAIDAPDRATAFAECDENTFASWGLEGDAEPDRWHQGPGQVDELWILDVGGSIVLLDAMYGPAAPADLVEEIRTLAESATFELP